MNVTTAQAERVADADGPGAAVPHSRSSRQAAVGMSVALAILTFYIHVHINGRVSNDHAAYLTMARQVTFGDVPIRDYVEHGTFGYIWLSEAARRLSGTNLLGEMLMSWSFIAVAYGLGVYLTWRFTGSIAAAVLSAVPAILLVPRPYAFPKILVYPMVVFLIWRYIEAPTRVRLWMMALFAAVALLVRFDHGVTAIVAFAAMVFLVHVADGYRRLGARCLEFAAAVCVALAPFGIFLAQTVGIGSHLSTMLSFGAYGMGQREPLTWRRFPPGEVLSHTNAIVFFYDLTLVMTALAVGVLLVMAWRDIRRRRWLQTRTLQTAALVGVWLISAPMLLRDNFDARVPDVAVVLAMVGGWLGTVLAGASYGMRPLALRAVLALVVLSVGGASVTAAAQRDAGRDLTERTRLLLSADGVDKARANLRDLAVEPPIDGYAPREIAGDPAIAGEHSLVRYLHECTEPRDRVLVTFFAPETYFYSGRAFAGDQWIYLNAFHNSDAEQRYTLRRLAEQRVPVILSSPETLAGMRQGWPLLAEYIAHRYERTPAYPAFPTVDIWVDRSRGVTRVLPGGLPCFR